MPGKQLNNNNLNASSYVKNHTMVADSNILSQYQQQNPRSREIKQIEWQKGMDNWMAGILPQPLIKNPFGHVGKEMQKKEKEKEKKNQETDTTKLEENNETSNIGKGRKPQGTTTTFRFMGGF